MFKLSEKYEVDRKILKSDCIRYSPSEISTINTPNSQIYINKLLYQYKSDREDSDISLLNSYLDLNFDVLHAATDNRYVDGNDIRLVDLGSRGLFSNNKLTTNSRKHLEDISHAHIVSLMYKLITSAKDTVDFSIGFDRSRDRRQREFTNNKNIKGKYHDIIMLKDVFGFAEHQERGTFGLGYKLTLTGNTENAVLNKDYAINIGKIKIDAIECYVPQYTPIVEEQSIIMKQIVNEIPTELKYIERSVFMKEVNT